MDSNDYQLLAVLVLGVIVVQFLIMRYYVGSAIDDNVDDKLRRSNKKMMKRIGDAFDKYMAPNGPDAVVVGYGHPDGHPHGGHPGGHPHGGHGGHGGHGYGGYDGHEHDGAEDSIDDPAEDYDEEVESFDN